MSTDYFFKFKKEKFEEIRKFLIEHPLRMKAKIGLEESDIFAFGSDKTANGMWIYIDKGGRGTITRYAGTSPINFGNGFDVLDEINEKITPIKDLICEYDLQK